jgi:hypothetical protein
MSRQYGYVSSTGATSTIKKVDAFTASGTWTVPAGVTYAVAHIRAGGGGVGSASSGTGGTSSVAFAGGTVSATGGLGQNLTSLLTSTGGVAGTANTGQGAAVSGYWQSGATAYLSQSTNGPRDGALITAGGAVTAGASITVTVGSGGVAGSAFAAGTTAAGGTGYVWIEYQV